MKRTRTTSADDGEREGEDQGDSSGEPGGPVDRLIAAASVGLEAIELTEAGKSEMTDLMCVHCHSMLFRPSTLVDGRTVCLPCGPKVKEMPAPGLSFGTKANTVLDAVAKACATDAYAAASMRHDGNKKFSAKEYSAAVEAYTEAIRLHDSDPLLWSNRAAARLALRDAGPALKDAMQGARLSGLVLPAVLLKCVYRRASALEQLGWEKDALSMFAFSVAFAKRTEQTPPLEGLTKLFRAMSKEEGKQKFEETLAEVMDSLSKESFAQDCICPKPASSEMTDDDDAAPKSNSDRARILDEAKLEGIRSEVDCPLCCEMLFEPTTLRCGHVLCRQCLARTLDHAFDSVPGCPMCRSDLAPYLVWLNRQAKVHARHTGNQYSHGSSQIAVTVELERILRRKFGEEYEARRSVASQQENPAAQGDQAQIPVFICSLAMPGVKCPLHIFEPRYRLMMRRCMESGNCQFGMVLSPDSKYGTMLRINSFNQMPDGRSFLDTVGERTFEIRSWGTKDGYSTAHVNWLESTDTSETEQEAAECAQKLREVCQNVAQARGPRYLEAVDSQVGPMPSSPEELIYWALAANIPGREMSTREEYSIVFGTAARRTSHLARIKHVLQICLNATNVGEDDDEEEDPDWEPPEEQED